MERKLTGLLKEHFTENALRQLLNAVYDGFGTAYRNANAIYGGEGGKRHGQFESPHAHWMHSFGRKASVDQSLHSTANRLGLFAKYEHNCNDSCPHVVIASGPFIVTPHYVHGPKEIVRPADYRDNYFRDPQMTLACMQADNDDTLRVIDKTRYAFLIYGESTDPRFPAFVDFVFPILGCTKYHPARLEMFSEFPDVVKSRIGILVADSEQIPDQSLKMKKKSQEG